LMVWVVSVKKKSGEPRPLLEVVWVWFAPG
jgi:hypothetical protein